MIKNMDGRTKKMLVLLISLPLLIIFLLVVIRSCSNSKSSYSEYENKMIKATEKYLDNKDLYPKTEGGIVTVSLDELMSAGYIKANSVDKCSGSVIVQANGISVNDNNYYLYIPDLVCDNYKTTHLIDKLKADIVTEKSGLYEVSDGFLYKGSKVNNFVSFFDKKYLIISIDNNNVLKLVKVDSEKNKVVWDAKFNPEVNRSYGKNDFSDSNIIDELYNQYLSTDDKKKKHMIGYSVCYGNRDYDDDKINKDSECLKKLDNQFISLMNIYDYAMASYDVDCNSIYSGSCSNYNYIYDNIGTTWLMNGLSNNTYEVYYYSYGISFDKAKVKNSYNMVIYLNGNELYTKGDGSYNNPYVINN